MTASAIWQLPPELGLYVAVLLAMIFAPSWTIQRYFAAVAAWRTRQLQDFSRSTLGLLGGAAVVSWMWVNVLINLWMTPTNGFLWFATLIFALVFVAGVAGASTARPGAPFLHRERT